MLTSDQSIAMSSELSPAAGQVRVAVPLVSSAFVYFYFYYPYTIGRVARCT